LSKGILIKNSELFHSIFFSQQECDRAVNSDAPARTTKEIRVDMQIRALPMAGKGCVKVCEVCLYGGIINTDYSNEQGKLASFTVLMSILSIRLLWT
jgi:hypothetical protein